MESSARAVGTFTSNVQELAEAINQGIFTVDELKRTFGRMGYELGEGVQNAVGHGEIVTITPEGQVRALERSTDIPIGIAIGGDLVRIGRVGRNDFTTEDFQRAKRIVERSWTNPGSRAIHASVAHMGSVAWGAYGTYNPRTRTAHQYQYTEKFSRKVQDKAWELLKKFMTPDQHFAFMEGSNIELQNRANTYRLLISRSGDFTILEGETGAGIVATAGKIYSQKYPLGDEIVAFLDWFNHRTEELIAQWNCGTYGIKREDELHGG